MRNRLLLAAALALWGVRPTAGAPPGPMNLQWSQDGSRLLVVTEAALVLIGPEGGEAGRVPLSAPATEAALSPDGRRVAWSQGGRAAWVYDFATGKKSQVYAAAEAWEQCGPLKWSGDGRRLAFSVTRLAASDGPEGFKLRSREARWVDADGTGARTLLRAEAP